MRLSLLVLVLFLETLAFSEEPPKSPAAVKARDEYDAAVKKLEEDYQAKVALLKTAYLKGLETAREAALVGKNLDEAQRISAVQKDLGEELPPKATFQVVAAWYGWKDKWLDVTPTIRKLVQGGELRMKKAGELGAGIADPAFGQSKSVVVVYRHKGVLRVAVTGDTSQLTLPSAR